MFRERSSVRRETPQTQVRSTCSWCQQMAIYHYWILTLIKRVISDLFISVCGWFECILHVAPVIYRNSVCASHKNIHFTKHPSIEKRSLLPALSLSMPNRTSLAEM